MAESSVRRGGLMRGVRACAPAWASLWTLLLALAPSGAGVAGGPPRPIQVEAAFLVNFVRFTEWPAARFDSPGDPYIVAVVGPADVADTVREVAAAAGPIQGRRIAVLDIDPHDVDDRHGEVLERLRGSHLVFVDATAGRVREPVLRAVAGSPVLTVGDGPEFASRGGMLGLVRSGAHLVFEANTRQIRAAGVQVSAKVLKLARILPGGAS